MKRIRTPLFWRLLKNREDGSVGGVALGERKCRRLCSENAGAGGFALEREVAGGSAAGMALADLFRKRRQRFGKVCLLLTSLHHLARLYSHRFSPFCLLLTAGPKAWSSAVETPGREKGTVE